MKQIYSDCAGIDIGSEKIFIGLLNRDGYTAFGTTTVDFHQAADYLLSAGIKSVAMEATGVYWIGLFDVLLSRGLKPVLVKAGDAKSLPGRDKTDGEDCQWICTLFSHGLLRESVIPEENIRELRHYMRLRADHIEMAASHKQHMQKALIMMNIRLPEAISDITGKSGLSMIEAILKGERDSNKLLLLCDSRIRKNKSAEILKALEGIYKKEYLFSLQQAYDCWAFYQKKLTECDYQISLWIDRECKDKQQIKAERRPKKSTSVNALRIDDVEIKLLQLTGGHDLTQIPGISANNGLSILSELGTDLTKWPTAKKFTKYLGLAGQKAYSGKMKKQKKSKTPRAGQIFREAAQVLLRSNRTGLGTFARKLQARKGPYIAIKATARKLAIQFYNVMTKGLDYVEAGAKAYEEKIRQTELLRLNKAAKKHGLSLSPLSN